MNFFRPTLNSGRMSVCWRQGDHFSGKPGNVGVFHSSQERVSEKLLHGITLLLTASSGLQQCSVDFCRPPRIACFEELLLMKLLQTFLHCLLVALGITNA